MMKLALLQCDHVAPKFRNITGGDYDDIFKAMFGMHAPSVTLQTFDVTKGVYPESPDDFAGFLTTGSKQSVYEDIPWVNQLKTYVQALYVREKKFVGICFGHQMIAHALGGSVAKSPNGWGIGVHLFDLYASPAWMQPPLTQIQLLMSCQDQVALLPDGSKVLAGNDFCPVGMYQVGDHFLGIQGHPEFTAVYAKALMEDRKDRIPAEAITQALATLSLIPQQKELVNWIVDFCSHDSGLNLKIK
jgi:GMP synthase-like glutamine amidotransferase